LQLVPYGLTSRPPLDLPKNHLENEAGVRIFHFPFVICHLSFPADTLGSETTMPNGQEGSKKKK
jgi:hypothetical protein